MAAPITAGQKKISMTLWMYCRTSNVTARAARQKTTAAPYLIAVERCLTGGTLWIATRDGVILAGVGVEAGGSSGTSRSGAVNGAPSSLS